MVKTPLDQATENLHAQNKVVGRARDLFLVKEAERKHFEASLIQGASGSSHAERTINAQATDAWLKFHKDLARLEAIYEFEKFKLSILEKEFQSQYLEIKDAERMIRKST